MLKFWPNRFLGHKASFISYPGTRRLSKQHKSLLSRLQPRTLFSHVGRNDITCLRCWFTTNVIIKLNGRKTFSKSLNWTEPMCKCRKIRISFVSRCPSWRTQALKAIIWQQWLPSAHSPLVWLPVIEPRTVVGRNKSTSLSIWYKFSSQVAILWEWQHWSLDQRPLWS